MAFNIKTMLFGGWNLTMSLKLMYITNDPEVARVAENHGVDRIWIDLETKGKELRQKNMDTVKSRHTVADVKTMSGILTKAELMVRINPWDAESVDEVEAVIAAGAERIMLPMWKSAEQTDAFLSAVNKRARTTLLLETKEAVECLDAVLENPLVEEIHIGLNDLHLSYGLTFMFELLSNGTVEMLCSKIGKKGIPYGFGGVARIGEGMLPAERILCEHVRLGSSAVILSRSFCDATKGTLSQIAEVFAANMKRIREYEQIAGKLGREALEENRKKVAQIVNTIVEKKGDG